MALLGPRVIIPEGIAESADLYGVNSLSSLIIANLPVRMHVANKVCDFLDRVNNCIIADSLVILCVRPCVEHCMSAYIDGLLLWLPNGVKNNRPGMNIALRLIAMQ